MSDHRDLIRTMFRDSSLDSGQDVRCGPAVIHKISMLPLQAANKSYLACSFAKPLWTSMDELMPGNRLGLSFSRNASISVAIASLERTKLELELSHVCKTFGIH